jgi:hypothetical protein
MVLRTLRRLRIGGKLVLGFGVLGALAGSVGLFALHGMASMDAATAVVRDEYLPAVSQVSRIAGAGTAA